VELSYEVSTSGRDRAAGRLRALVAERRTAHGGWCMISSPFAAEVLSAAGCDWLCIDLQHGLIDEDAMRSMVQAAAIRATPVVVRVPWNEPGAIMRALDAGAEGVIVPMVNTPDEARAAAGASRYPPLGFRSWGPLRSGMAQPDFNPALGNEQTICLVMIETQHAVENVDAILDVPGVDGVFVGPNDLAISHSGGNQGAGTSQRDVEMIERVAVACARRGLVAGISCTGPDDARRWGRAGYSLLGLPSDAGLLGAAMVAQLSSARAAEEA
jgi:4-hydroxy-2-oxoheptanedioate aldolase